MKYRGYSARVEFDQCDHIFVGRVIGLRDGINFHGSTVDEIETAFRDSVNDYLAACEALGQAPEKPYSGKIALRIPPEVHAAVACAAEIKGESINSWITEVLEEKIRLVS